MNEWLENVCIQGARVESEYQWNGKKCARNSNKYWEIRNTDIEMYTQCNFVYDFPLLQLLTNWWHYNESG